MPDTTITLTGNPRRGILHFPPRPDYEVRVARTETGAEARFRDGDWWTHAALVLIPATPELDGVPASDSFWHGEVLLDSYRFGLRADPEMRALTLIDGLIQPHSGNYCAVTEDGRVVVEGRKA